ncbi:hypothetical protein [Burkholderia ambifaria]|jgi:hypothetical protein|uniref:hypothetical protein n=1 Tax=Burkholderia ambifaria TaxID=152480 RepID=UPI001B92CC7D|nr:hypothetical protein [Burkholderia ambifaria]MBR8175780.1 hypothetical protein [Burkholderia ambifaria]
MRSLLIIQEETQVKDFQEFVFFAAGSLNQARDFKKESKLARTLPPALPVLTCPVEESDLRILMGLRMQRQCFGFGSVPMTGDKVMTIRLQLDGLQVYWLADMSDREVWVAIDAWRKAGKVPFCFGFASETTQDCMLGTVDIAAQAPRISNFRGRVTPEFPEGIWEQLADLAASGVMQLQATSDIPGVALEHVLVNVLATKRLREHTGVKFLPQKPVLATTGGAGADLPH